MSPPPAASAIVVRSLVKTFGPLRAVDGLDLEIRQGECFGLLGPNGAGKTTTIEILEGLQRADSGEVIVLGRRWDREEAELRERIGIQLQETQLYDKLSVEETLSLFRSFYERPLPIDQVIDAVGLGEKRKAWVGKLSGGQKQRLAIACSLVADPELFFFDEPTTGLDPTSRRQVWDILTAIRERGRTVVLTTHYMEEAEKLCDRVAIVDHGKVIAIGTPAALVSSIGGEQIIELATNPVVDEALLESLPGLVRVRASGASIRLTVKELHTALPALLSRLRDAGVSVTELLTRHATLEDVFLNLTGHKLSEAPDAAATETAA